MKVLSLTLSNAQAKTCQIPHVIFKTISQFFFKLCITFQSHERKLLCAFLGQSLNTLHGRNQSMWEFLRLLSARVKSVFLQILHHYSVSWDVTTLYLFSWNFMCILVKLFMSSQKSELLHFDGLLLAKLCIVSVKKAQKSYLSWYWRVMQNLKKN